MTDIKILFAILIIILIIFIFYLVIRKYKNKNINNKNINNKNINNENINDENINNENNENINNENINNENINNENINNENINNENNENNENINYRIDRPDNIDTNGLFRIRIFRRIPTLIFNDPVIPTKNKNIPNKYYKSIQTHDNDSQNVHNSQVISSLTRKYKRLVELNNYFSSESQVNELINAGITIDDIKNSKIEETMAQIKYNSNYFNDEFKKQKINKVINEISKGNSITSISYEYTENNELIPIKENWILTLIWERIHHPDNKKNVKVMEIALLDQLIDCIQKNNDTFDNIIMQALFQTNINEGDNEEFNDTHLVCINGRVGRIISALTLLDADSILSEPEKDDKEIANLAYMKASSILQEELKKQNIKKLYIKDVNNLTSSEKEKLKKFENHVKDQIENILLKEYKETIPTKDLIEIIKKAKEGV